MPGHPTKDVQAVIDRLAEQRARTSPPIHAEGVNDWVAAYRDSLLGMTEFSGPPESVASIELHRADGIDGPLDLRVYRPAGGVLPAILFMHGGGFVAGSLDTHDACLRTLANATGWLIAAVNYRVAPEYPFPAAPEDGYAALRHLAACANTMDIDPARLVVAGDSAGGTLAAAVALMARDRGGPALAGVICLYPNMDLRPGVASYSRTTYDGAVVRLDELRRGLALYLPPGVDPAQPYASPVLAALDGLPPALVITCEFDPLADEGVAFAEKLRAAGNAVRHDRLIGMIHGALQMAGVTAAGRDLVRLVGEWLAGLSHRQFATQKPDGRST